MVKVIPAVDVWQGQVVRLSRGDFSTPTIYGDDPVAMGRRWQAEGAELVHVVDLEGARHGSFNAGLWASWGTAGVAFQAGGGLRSPETVASVIEFGATRAVLGSVAVWQPHAIARLVAAVGAERVVAAVDVRDERAMGSGWEDGGRPIAEVLDDLIEADVARVLLTAIARDGMLEGPDLDLLGRVRGLYPKLALIASGGVSSLADLASLKALGIEEAVVGRALYEGRLSIGEALRV